MSRVFAMVLVTVLLGSTAAAAETPTKQTQLAAARALWKRQHVNDYRFRVTVSCFCANRGNPVTVTVHGSRSSGASAVGSMFRSFPALFKEIRAALNDEQAGPITVHYDPRRGFPRSGSIDRIKGAADDEVSWKIDRFRVL